MIIEPVFDEVVDLEGISCEACGLALTQTAHKGRQVGTVGTGTDGLPKIAIYHWEHAPTFLRAVVRANECEELESMMDENEDPRVDEEPEPEMRQCAAETFAGSRYGPTPEPPEYCENEAEEGSDYCKDHREPDDDDGF